MTRHKRPIAPFNLFGQLLGGSSTPTRPKSGPVVKAERVGGPGGFIRPGREACACGTMLPKRIPK